MNRDRWKVKQRSLRSRLLLKFQLNGRLCQRSLKSLLIDFPFIRMTIGFNFPAQFEQESIKIKFTIFIMRLIIEIFNPGLTLIIHLHPGYIRLKFAACDMFPKLKFLTDHVILYGERSPTNENRDSSSNFGVISGKVCTAGEFLDKVNFISVGNHVIGKPGRRIRLVILK